MEQNNAKTRVPMMEAVMKGSFAPSIPNAASSQRLRAQSARNASGTAAGRSYNVSGNPWKQGLDDETGRPAVERILGGAWHPQGPAAFAHVPITARGGGSRLEVAHLDAGGAKRSGEGTRQLVDEDGVPVIHSLLHGKHAAEGKTPRTAIQREKAALQQQRNAALEEEARGGGGGGGGGGGQSNSLHLNLHGLTRSQGGLKNHAKQQVDGATGRAMIDQVISGAYVPEGESSRPPRASSAAALVAPMYTTMIMANADRHVVSSRMNSASHQSHRHHHPPRGAPKGASSHRSHRQKVVDVKQRPLIIDHDQVMREVAQLREERAVLKGDLSNRFHQKLDGPGQQPLVQGVVTGQWHPAEGAPENFHFASKTPAQARFLATKRGVGEDRKRNAKPTRMESGKDDYWINNVRKQTMVPDSGTQTMMQTIVEGNYVPRDKWSDSFVAVKLGDRRRSAAPPAAPASRASSSHRSQGGISHISALTEPSPLVKEARQFRPATADGSTVSGRHTSGGRK
jgi:hypothetical protein